MSEKFYCVRKPDGSLVTCMATTVRSLAEDMAADDGGTVVEVEVIEVEALARLRQELAEDREAIRRLLAVLPDSEHEDDESWSGCWDWLDDAAQEAVKEARNLPAVRRAIESGGG